MAFETQDDFDICRLCLGLNNLTPLCKLENASFTIQDIEHYTGLQISPEEQLLSAICDQCITVMQNSVTFRATCLNNDNVFKKLFHIRNDNLKLSIEDSDNYVLDESESLEGGNYETEPVLPTSNHEVWFSEDDESSDLIDREELETKTMEVKDPAKRKKSMRHEKKLCVLCGRLVINLYGHIRNHNKEKRYSCPQCPIKMNNETNLKRHIETVHEKKIVVRCELCGKGFTHTNILKVHKTAHHGIGQTYECKICAKTFKYPSSYRSHVMTKHGVDKPKELPCKICNRIFYLKKTLQTHQLVHTTDRPYPCDLCPKRFRSAYGRNIHRLTHSGIRFPCTMCDKSFGYKNLLASHYKSVHPDTNVKL